MSDEPFIPGQVTPAPEGVSLKIAKIWNFSETSPDAVNSLLEEPTSVDANVITIYEDDINTLAGIGGQNLINWRVEADIEKLGYRAIVRTALAWDPTLHRTAPLVYQTNLKSYQLFCLPHLNVPHPAQNFREYFLPQYPYMRKAGKHELAVLAQLRKESVHTKYSGNGTDYTFETFNAFPSVGETLDRRITVEILKGKRPAEV